MPAPRVPIRSGEHAAQGCAPRRRDPHLLLLRSRSSESRNRSRQFGRRRKKEILSPSASITSRFRGAATPACFCRTYRMETAAQILLGSNPALCQVDRVVINKTRMSHLIFPKVCCSLRPIAAPSSISAQLNVHTRLTSAALTRLLCRGEMAESLGMRTILKSKRGKEDTTEKH